MSRLQQLFILLQNDPLIWSFKLSEYEYEKTSGPIKCGFLNESKSKLKTKETVVL